MKITITRKLVQIDDARIIFRNFAGEADKFNREGDRNFALIIPDQETADALLDAGYNVKIKPPRDGDESPFMYLPIKVKYTEKSSPTAYLRTGDRMNELNEDTISLLDNIEIDYVDMDIRPYDWDVSGKQGRTAYLQSICVTQKVDRFAERYASDEA